MIFYVQFFVLISSIVAFSFAFRISSAAGICIIEVRSYNIVFPHLAMNSMSSLRRIKKKRDTKSYTNVLGKLVSSSLNLKDAQYCSECSSKSTSSREETCSCGPNCKCIDCKCAPTCSCRVKQCGCSPIFKCAAHQ